VVVEATPLVSEAELGQLRPEAGLLLTEKGGEIDLGGLRRWGLVRHPVMLRGPSLPLYPHGGVPPRRHAGGARARPWCSAGWWRWRRGPGAPGPPGRPPRGP